MKSSVFQRFFISHVSVVFVALTLLFFILYNTLPRFLYEMKVNDLIGMGEYLLDHKQLNGENAPPSKVGFHTKVIKKSEPISRGWQLTEKEWATLAKGEMLTYKREKKRFHIPVTVVILPLEHEQAFILSTPISETEKIISEVRKMILIVFVITLLAIFIISYYLSKRFQRHTNKLQQATREIANGNYNVLLQTKDHHEWADLAHDINVMANKLNENEQELKRQIQLRSQFLADVSHELKTPLTSIRGLIAALRNGVGSKDEQERMLLLMENETFRLIRLVYSVMDLERIRSGEIILHISQIQMQDFLKSVVEQMDVLAEEKELTLTANVNEPFMIEADEDRLRQMLVNLIRNAIQFTAHGFIHVKALKESKWAYLSVIDTGIGLKEAEKRDIFERFYKVDPSRTKSHGEMGLGLALVSQLASAHGGSVSVTSEYGKGSTFTIKLPLFQND